MYHRCVGLTRLVHFSVPDIAWHEAYTHPCYSAAVLKGLWQSLEAGEWSTASSSSSSERNFLAGGAWDSMCTHFFLSLYQERIGDGSKPNGGGKGVKVFRVARARFPKHLCLILRAAAALFQPEQALDSAWKIR